MKPFGRYGIVIALIGALAVAGCSPASQAKGWAEKAQARPWIAEYQVVFHQEDGDLTMTVVESRHNTLLLEVRTPGGAILTREFKEGRFTTDLDNGSLQWPNQVGHPPVWSLTSLAERIAYHPDLREEAGWIILEGFSLKAHSQGLIEVKYLDEWTLVIQEFQWH